MKIELTIDLEAAKAGKPQDVFWQPVDSDEPIIVAYLAANEKVLNKFSTLLTQNVINFLAVCESDGLAKKANGESLTCEIADQTHPGSDEVQ